MLIITTSFVSRNVEGELPGRHFEMAIVHYEQSVVYSNLGKLASLIMSDNKCNGHHFNLVLIEVCLSFLCVSGFVWSKAKMWISKPMLFNKICKFATN